MPITPIDIRKKKFSTQLRGINAQEVKNFLEMVANEMEVLRKERALLAEKVDELQAKLEGYVKTEKLLKDTLVTAQAATEEIKQAT
ncbi:MAG: DivIVA domain-containing protein, partial [candidate division WOR-3 bacterium]